MFTLETIAYEGRPALALALAARGCHLPLAAAGARLGVPFADAPLFEHLQVWVTAWPAIAAIAERAAVVEGAEGAGELSALFVRGARVLPQFGGARKVIGAGTNYYKHLVEMGVHLEKEPNRPPFFFLKPPTALAGPGRTVPLDASIKMLDWEVELTAVIGRRARHVGPADALDYVAGYTVAVDVSARDRLLQPDSIFKFDFLAGKGQDGFCPIANGLVPAARLGDPQAARLRLSVNGVTKQDASTDDMIYSVAELVSWASRQMTLEPGDLLLTGSPEGVGFPRREFLKAGDVMRVELPPHLSFDAEVFAADGGQP